MVIAALPSKMQLGEQLYKLHRIGLVDFIMAALPPKMQLREQMCKLHRIGLVDLIQSEQLGQAVFGIYVFKSIEDGSVLVLFYLDLRIDTPLFDLSFAHTSTE